MNTIKIRKSNLVDEPVIIQLLSDCKLPTQDIIQNKIDFTVATNDDNLVGCIGIEPYGKDALLRSFAVSDNFRNNGLGSDLLQLMVKACKEMGIEKIHLLTTTAEKYFVKYGFVKSDRASAPKSISETTEFSEICPSTSIYLTLNIVKQKLDMSSRKINTLFPTLNSTVENLIQQFDQIAVERKTLLRELTRFIQQDGDWSVYLNFICTHNSRRSHISQLWAQAAAHYFNMKNVTCFSGGTEATAFNPRAVKAMKDVGFLITLTKDGSNPHYEVGYANGVPPILAFSKKYYDSFNPVKDFAAIMTCSHADENCPLVVGASARIALTYDDPKEFDGSELEIAKYAERVHEIGREILYAFSQV